VNIPDAFLVRIGDARTVGPTTVEAVWEHDDEIVSIGTLSKWVSAMVPWPLPSRPCRTRTRPAV
jgi:hypothetical protein